MFFAPTFEPHSPIEPQWFPLPPHTHTSQLDQLERLEEDRKRRLHSIANVAAKTPIGLADGSNATANNAANTKQNAYSQYRYYPPPSEESVALAIQHQQERRANPPSTASRGRRRVRANRSSLQSTASEANATHQSDGNNNLSHLSHSHISHDTTTHSRTSIDSFQQSFTMSLHSPSLDPRGGGGRRSSDWYASRLHRVYNQLSFNASEMITPTNAGFDTSAQQQFDMTTPEDAGVTNTPGHGHSEDVYSQRRTRGQRRRRPDS